MDIPIVAEVVERVEIRLSEMYSTPEYRLKMGEIDLIRWRRTKPVRCVECAAFKDEPDLGMAGHRRVVQGRVSMVLCNIHHKMWIERDRLDSTGAAWFDRVAVERCINNYRFGRTDPIGRTLSDAEMLSAMIWFLRNGFRRIDIQRAIYGDSSISWRKFKMYMDRADELMERERWQTSRSQ